MQRVSKSLPPSGMLTWWLMVVVAVCVCVCVSCESSSHAGAEENPGSLASTILTQLAMAGRDASTVQCTRDKALHRAHALLASGKVARAVACTSSVLQSSRTTKSPSFTSQQLEGSLWILTASILRDDHDELVFDTNLITSPANTRVALAQRCLRLASRMLGPITAQVAQWHVLGPLAVGKNELDGTPAAAPWLRASPFGQRHDALSEFAVGAQVRWRTIKAPVDPTQTPFDWKAEEERRARGPDREPRLANGWLGARDFVATVQFEDVAWHDLRASMQLLEFQAMLVGHLYVAVEGRFAVQCLGVHTVRIDGQSVVGDIYMSGMVRTVLHLQPGAHRIDAQLRAKVRGAIQCRAVRVGDDDHLAVFQPFFQPDLVSGYLFSPFVSLPVQSLHPTPVRVQFKLKREIPQSGCVDLAPAEDQPAWDHVLQPGQMVALPVALQQGDCPAYKRSGGIARCKHFGHESVQVVVSVVLLDQASGEQFESAPVGVRLRCRDLHSQSFVYTFLDHDGVASQAAAVAPRGKSDCTVGPGCPILLAFHGTGVQASNMADSFKFKAKKHKDYVFGVGGAWVVAPTRHGAHNWEQLGTNTGVAAVSALVSMVEDFAALHSPGVKGYKKLGADIHRWIIVGHSMGGHGALQLATHYPDRALCVVPLAAWISKEYYGDSNRLFVHDQQNAYVDPALKAVFEATVAENYNEMLVGNIAGVPFLARVGAKDKTVHPWYLRRTTRLLLEAGAPRDLVKFVEVPNKDHWWWDTNKANDGGVVNDRQLRRFFASCVDQNHTRLPAPLDAFTVTTHNPHSMGTGRNGFIVLQQLRPYRLSQVTVNTAAKAWTVATRNVRRFALQCAEHGPLVCEALPNGGIVVDGTALSPALVEQVAHDITHTSHFCRLTGKGAWDVCMQSDLARTERVPATYGPIRAVWDRPITVVVPEQSPSLMRLAVYLANMQFQTTYGTFSIVSDAEAMEDDERTLHGDRNLILLGSPENNAVLRELAALGLLPIAREEGGFRVGECLYRGDSLAAAYLAPLPVPDGPTGAAGTISAEGTVNMPGNSRLGLALVLDAVDEQGWRAVAKLAEPTIPPMVRHSFSNQVPDYMVVDGARIDWQGLGSTLAAGFFDNGWNPASELGYGTQC